MEKEQLFFCIINDDFENVIQACCSQFHASDMFETIPPNIKCFGDLPIPFLNLAASFGAYNTVNALIELNANVDCVDGAGFTPFHSAAYSGNVDILQLLFDSSAEIDEKSDDSSSPIHPAAENNHIEVINWLLNHDQDINSTECHGCSALSIAAMKGYYDLVVFLIEKGADLKIKDEDGNTPIHLAIKHGHYNIAAYLIDLNYVDINSTNNKGENMMMIASLKGDFDLLGFLIDHGINPTYVDLLGQNLLHYAVKSKNVRIVEEIIRLKIASPGKVNVNGFTPLHIACQIGATDIVNVLCQVDISIVNNIECGDSPLHLACKHHHLETMQSLCSIPNVDVAIENHYAQNILHIAAMSSYYDIVDFIIKLDRVDVGLPDSV